MINLDKKDKKILFYLLQNSRQSYKSLGKKVGASKEFISYRLKRMTDKKIITNFTIVSGIEKLGYGLIQTHYKFVNVSPKKKEEIIRFLVENKHSMYVSLIEGSYDLQVEFFIGNSREFEQFMDEIREKYCNYLIFQLSKIPIRAEFYTYSFLVDGIDKEMFVDWRWGQKLYYIDDLDHKILLELANNSRTPIVELANNLNTTVTTINNRMKKLEQNTIMKYSINIDWSKLGYRWFHLQISLNDYKRKKHIIEYMRKNPYLIRRFKFLDLAMDLHFTLLLKDMHDLRSIIEGISSTFPDVIKDYHFYSTYKVYKYKMVVPEILNHKSTLNRSTIKKNNNES